ncbi:MAG: hypothetical protein AABZ47_13045 [Planctomycetota bacterium]
MQKARGDTEEKLTGEWGNDGAVYFHIDRALTERQGTRSMGGEAMKKEYA